MAENEPNSEARNPYASPAAFSMPADYEADKVPDAQKLAAFVGSKDRYYLGKWRRLLENWNSSAGFNWGACLLTGLWLSYRKMHLQALIFYSIILVESILEELLFVVYLGQEESPPLIGTIVSLGAALICGWNGNRWYLNHARKTINLIAAQGFVDGEATYALLAKRGGTNLLGSIGTFLLFIIVLMAVFISIELSLEAIPGSVGY